MKTVSGCPNERALAEQAYTVTAFDYVNAPVGSRDWCLFWSGWQACLHPREEPPPAPAPLSMAEESAQFEAWRTEQIECLRRNGYAEAAEAFYNFGSIHWASWQARAALAKREK